MTLWAQASLCSLCADAPPLPPGAVQLVAPPALALATAVAEAHAMASTSSDSGASASYPRLEALGQSMRYTAALLWASGAGLRGLCFALG